MGASKPPADASPADAELESVEVFSFNQRSSSSPTAGLIPCVRIPTIARLLREAHGGMVGDLRMLSIREHRFPFLRKVGERGG